MSHPVIIIGAGIAGLGAAEVLLEEGIEVLVLEAAGQPGGRVRTLEGFADFPIELGAEEVHGTENSVYALVEQADVELIHHKTADDQIRLDGRLMSLATAASDVDVAHAVEFLCTVGDYMGENFTAQEVLRRTHFPRRSWHYLDSRLGVENGTTLDRLAMRGFEGYERGWENREWNFTLRRSYLEIFAPMIERLGQRLWLNSPVAAVDWSGIPRVTLGDGRQIEADAILVTASVPVLREEVIHFAPPLPPERMVALREVGMDGGMKILLKFRERFWPEWMYFLHTDGFLPQFWATGKGKSEQPILTAFVGGSRYEWFRENGINPITFALGELDQLFGGKTATEQYLAGHLADWGEDPWIRGLYSYPTTATRPETRAELARALGDKLFFAGEATDVHGHSGTVHGALDSGRRAAREVLARS